MKHVDNLEQLLKTQQEFKEQQEKELEELIKLGKEAHKKYFQDFQNIYLNVIKPQFQKLSEVFAEYGHSLKLIYEHLEEPAAQPEVLYNLLIDGETYGSISIYIFGKGVKENVLFYFIKSSRDTFRQPFQFNEITAERIDRTITKALMTEMKK